MTIAQRISLQSLRTLARLTSPTVGELKPLSESSESVVVVVTWGTAAHKFLIERDGCVAEVLG